MSFCNDYDFEIDNIVKFIEENKARKILLQMPEGLQVCSSLIVDSLKNRLGDSIEIYLSLNPSYGSCLVDEYGASEIGADVVIHIGHDEYPLYKPRKPTLFIRGDYKKIDKEKIRETLKSICNEYPQPVCVASTAQHIKELNGILNNIDACSTLFKGIILGCVPADTKECGIDVIVAGGRFHCIAQALNNYSKYGRAKTICIDPYTNIVWNPEKEVEKILRVRLWKVREAFDARKWLIIDGFYGQHRQSVVDLITNEIKKRGMGYLIVKALKIDRSLLDNIYAGEGFDAVAVVACPHIAFDLMDYSRPVLTVGEALMALHKDITRYRYPW
ncbi:MAG: 2-(3-amino-3-carboxypropyl)histidine synthase subunit 1/2 [Ignisphaera sp.]